ncbi:MAG TPA: ABC-ATPase domain-containing protein [Gammaproteobacteria bacterium]|nr:ABC-ATPase domain-containing protein [Gammaproteobacteria bacterium]
MSDLHDTLLGIDGRGYKAYREITGAHRFPRFRLLVDHVQADPFAAPSRLRAIVGPDAADLPEDVWRSRPRMRAARDFIARAFRSAAHGEPALQIDAGGQTVLERSAVLLTEQGVELRFTAVLPARGRRIRGRAAAELLCRRLPEVVARAAEARNLDCDALRRHCRGVEDQVALREALAGRDLVAFVADDAVLPRRSGVDDRPLPEAITFRTPDRLRVSLETPNAGTVTGMGIPRGITLIAGGGFHGKSTLLSAVQQGVYDHLPGDGRDRVVTVDNAVKIRAEDGRAVHGVDLSPYINHLPYGKPTSSFTTELASGSTSQAASLQEALEAGAATLLVDEDTSATNFMIRDERMQALVAKEHEPITPFVDRVRQLRDVLGVSTVLVMGGSGDYFDCADCVIQMQDYRPLDATQRAREIASTHLTGRREESGEPLARPSPRVLDATSLDPTRGKGKRKVQARGRDTLLFGRDTIDLRAVEQLVDSSQLRAIGMVLARMAEAGGQIVDPAAWIARCLERGDWSRIAFRPDGDLAAPRTFEVLAALNRLRSVRFD